MKFFFAAALAMGLHWNAWAAPVISSLAQWNGVRSVTSWGAPDTATYGQAFTPAGPELYLQDFSFFINDQGISIGYYAYVQEFDTGTRTLVGDILWKSGLQTTLGTFGSFQQYTANPAGLLLNAGTSYYVYFSTAEVSQPNAASRWGVAAGLLDSQLDGLFFKNQSDGDGFSSTSGPGGVLSGLSGGSFAFVANFSADAPELDAATWIAPVFLWMGLVLASRRKTTP